MSRRTFWRAKIITAQRFDDRFERDDAGRLAMTRLDADLKPVWKVELPLSETDSVRQVATWLVSGHLVVVGQLQTESHGVHRRTLQAATIHLKTGPLRSMDLAGNAASR